MPLSITRRHATLGLCVLMSVGIGPGFAEEISPVADIERRHGGRLGLFALDTGSGRTLAYRADERFLMCSTFKGLLAALILARVDAGQESLSRMVHYSEKDLIFTSPVTKANLSAGAMSIEGLCKAIVEASDNTAAVLLMRTVGGPPGLTKFIRSLGDTVTRSDRYEPTSNRYSGVLDTTSPKAIALSLHKILLGNALTSRSRQQLESWMIACTPGLRRIRAALPLGWTAGDRPGTSIEEETNDCAIVRPPGRAPLIVAAYYDAPKLNMNDREAVLYDAGSAFVKWAGG